jgi:heme/copper-type cytochrome/quinol oxidase subunit 2
MSKFKLLASSFALMPILALAQSWGGETYFTDIAGTISGVINILIPAIMGLVFIGFFWFLYKYVMGSAEDKEKSKVGLFWSVIAIVIMISIYGIANLLQDLTGATGGDSRIEVPVIDFDE